MERDTGSNAVRSTMTLSPIVIPPIVVASPEERERRRRLFDETVKLRERIGPIGVAADELIRIGREEARY